MTAAVQGRAAGAMVQAPAPAGNGLLDMAGTIADASPPVMLAIFILVLLRGWLVLPREVEYRDKRIAELERERDEYKDMAFRALNVGERVVSAAEERTR